MGWFTDVAARQLTNEGPPGPAFGIKRIGLVVGYVTADAHRHKVVERIYGTAGGNRPDVVSFELAGQSAPTAPILVTLEAGPA